MGRVFSKELGNFPKLSPHPWVLGDQIIQFFFRHASKWLCISGIKDCLTSLYAALINHVAFSLILTENVRSVAWMISKCKSIAHGNLGYCHVSQKMTMWRQCGLLWAQLCDRPLQILQSTLHEHAQKLSTHANMCRKQAHMQSMHRKRAHKQTCAENEHPCKHAQKMSTHASMCGTWAHMKTCAENEHTSKHVRKMSTHANMHRKWAHMQTCAENEHACKHSHLSCDGTSTRCWLLIAANSRQERPSSHSLQTLVFVLKLHNREAATGDPYFNAWHSESTFLLSLFQFLYMFRQCSYTNPRRLWPISPSICIYVVRAHYTDQNSMASKLLYYYIVAFWCNCGQ